MASVVDRVNKLLALAGSSNIHEARNAALAAAKLIREHGLLVREADTERRKTPRPTPRSTPRPRRPSSKKTRAESLATIESPLGGDCIVCGKRYRAGTTIHWSDADGGIHVDCIDRWKK
jgi:hypothetical protein